MSRKLQIRLEFQAMATDFDFQVVVDSRLLEHAKQTLFEVKSEVQRCETSLTRFQEESPVAQLNRTYNEWVDADERLIQTLNLSYSLYDFTKSSFNPFRGAHKDAVEIKGNQARRVNKNCVLDFGAIGKGIALDRVQILLRREGFEDYLLNAGGSSLLVSGLDAYRESWKIGWCYRKENERFYGVSFETCDVDRPYAIGISGEMEQGKHIDGVSSEHEVTSVWVDHASAAVADALATSLFVESTQSNSKFSNLEDQSFQGRDVGRAVLMRDRRLFWSPGFEKWKECSSLG